MKTDRLTFDLHLTDLLCDPHSVILRRRYGVRREPLEPGTLLPSMDPLRYSCDALLGGLEVPLACCWETARTVASFRGMLRCDGRCVFVSAPPQFCAAEAPTVADPAHVRLLQLQASAVFRQYGCRPTSLSVIIPIIRPRKSTESGASVGRVVIPVEQLPECDVDAMVVDYLNALADADDALRASMVPHPDEWLSWLEASSPATVCLRRQSRDWWHLRIPDEPMAAVPDAEDGDQT